MAECDGQGLESQYSGGGWSQIWGQPGLHGETTFQKKTNSSLALWFIPVISATQEGEIERITVWGLNKKVSKTPLHLT
jgi:hypothetical protein